MGDSNLSDEALAELLTLTREVDNQGTITYRNAAGQRVVTDQFKHGTGFQNVVALYVFDKRLRFATYLLSHL